LEVLYPPYEANFVFDLFSTPVDELLLIATPALISLTEQSLEDDVNEIQNLEKQLEDTQQSLRSLDCRLSSLRGCFESLSHCN